MPTKKTTSKKTSSSTGRSKRNTAAKKPTATKKKSAAKSSSPKAASSKRTATKRSASKQQAKTADARPLVTASPEKAFWVNDGTVLHSLVDLAEALHTMDEAVFAHHVGKERNDFADWVSAVLEDASCADAMRRSRKPGPARTVVVRHLKLYEL